MSRPFEPKGRVAATVRMRAEPDGASVLLSCTIENQSDLAIPQVLFPDIDGLIPFAGEAGTEFRTAGFVKKPFQELKLTEDDGSWYARRDNWDEFESASYGTSMTARWMDLGSLAGGFSLFPKLWSWGPLSESGKPSVDRVFLHLSQVDGRLRLMCEHKVTINPGEKWSSPEYVLTPHRGGWAKGVEPFREWVKQNMDRSYPLPKHIRQTIGFRTVWMTQQYGIVDPSSPTVVWRFKDLPVLAAECKEHGLKEMVIWSWQPWEMPDQPSPQLGTAEELGKAIADCRALGVNVSLFVSLMTMPGAAPAKYGWKTNAGDSWTYHTELIPMLRPYYAKAGWGGFSDQTNPSWQEDVVASLAKLVQRGWTSITWDQSIAAPGEPNIYTIFAKVRGVAKEKDPESTFSGESINNLDMDSRWLDYTWNWRSSSETEDRRALLNAYPTPRFNVNIGTSSHAVKRLFMDHMFLNVMPSKPEGINGSAKISDHPDLSQALKTCARLHDQFLNYLEDGVLVGDCLLAEPCQEGRINGFVMGDRALMIVMNTGAEPQLVSFACDFAPWLASPSGRYRVATYNEEGNLRPSYQDTGASWRVTTPVLKPYELVLYEVVPAKSRD